MKIIAKLENQELAERAAKILEQLNNVRVRESEEILGNVIVLWAKLAGTEEKQNALIFDLFRFVVDCEIGQAPVEKVKE